LITKQYKVLSIKVMCWNLTYMECGLISENFKVRSQMWCTEII
jgi:hypothetical protein